MRPRLLDLGCGDGGCSVGYARAGFDVEGVDIVPHPRYPFKFHLGDMLTWPLDGFDAVHVSPPCQRWSALSNAAKSRDNHPDLITPMRERLRNFVGATIIENVPRSPLEHPIQLCGTMFGLRVLRHRWFELNFTLTEPFHYHAGRVSDGTYVGHRDGGKVLPGRVRPPLWTHAQKAEAMGIDWPVTHKEMRQMVPPAYTEFIGREAIRRLSETI